MDFVKNLPWPIIIAAVGGMLAPIAFNFLRAWSKKLRGDKDPGNDWVAELIDAAIKANDNGDFEKSKDILADIKKGKKPK